MNIVFGLWAKSAVQLPNHPGEGAGGARGRRWSVLMAFSKFLNGPYGLSEIATKRLGAAHRRLADRA